MHKSEPNAANGWSVRVISDDLRTNASEAISCRSLPIRLFSGRYQRRVLSIAGNVVFAALLGAIVAAIIPKCLGGPGGGSRELP